jgi:beta-galactosidase
VEEAASITVHGTDFSVAFTRASGVLSSYTWRGTALVQSGPALNIWRAPTDNDGFKWMSDDEWILSQKKLLSQWLAVGLDRLERKLESLECAQLLPQAVQIKTVHTVQAKDVPAGFHHSAIYTIYGNGAVRMENDVIPFGDLPVLPRMGVALVAPAGFEQFTWFGRGPDESYIDRKAGVAVGLYTGTVDEQYVPYIMPQENGNKTDVRWAALSDAAGIGLLVAAEPLLEVSASHFTAHDLYKAYHTNELVRRPEVCFNLDLAQCGLGGNSCGPKTLDKYMLWPAAAKFAILLRPFAPGEALAPLAREWVEAVS